MQQSDSITRTECEAARAEMRAEIRQGFAELRAMYQEIIRERADLIRENGAARERLARLESTRVVSNGQVQNPGAKGSEADPIRLSISIDWRWGAMAGGVAFVILRALEYVWTRILG